MRGIIINTERLKERLAQIQRQIVIGETLEDLAVDKYNRHAMPPILCEMLDDPYRAEELLGAHYTRINAFVGQAKRRGGDLRLTAPLRRNRLDRNSAYMEVLLHHLNREELWRMCILSGRLNSHRTSPTLFELASEDCLHLLREADAELLDWYRKALARGESPETSERYRLCSLIVLELLNHEMELVTTTRVKPLRLRAQSTRQLADQLDQPPCSAICRQPWCGAPMVTLALERELPSSREFPGREMHQSQEELLSLWSNLLPAERRTARADTEAEA